MELNHIQIRDLARAIVREMDSHYSADLAQKWEDGTIIFRPADPDLAEHEIKIETLLHKIVMVRDNLRVLEQQINKSDSISEGEKVKFQRYITKCYGSMTSFNFLFWDNKDKFSSK